MVNPLHGGDLRAAIASFGGAAYQWIDLSTGINPTCYPLPNIPVSVLQRLPVDQQPLLAAAKAYYGSADLVAVNGSQAAIEALARLRRPCRVGVLEPTYAEHAFQWRRQGHQVEALTAEQVTAALTYLDVLVVVRPNNPTGAMLCEHQLRAWQQTLAARGGWLIVDEAFIDATPAKSLMKPAAPEGLIILRSVGKFFGLAGIRLGFVYASDAIRAALQQQLPLWSVNGVAIWAAERALRDVSWHQQMRSHLAAESQRMAELLSPLGFMQAQPLFCYVSLAEQSTAMWQHLAKRQIWVRHFPDQAALRFGLPHKDAWPRLERAIKEWL